jgi:hypothetical protein
MPECSICGGPAVPLGQLGSLFHCRCRNCGMQFSVPAADLDLDEPEDDDEDEE